MHKQRIAILIAAIIGILGVFLPFMKSFIGYISLIETQDGTGYIIIVLFVISILVALIGNKDSPLTKGKLAGTIVPGIIPGIILLLLVIARGSNTFARAFTVFEIGFYTIIIASGAILLFGLTLKDYAFPTSSILINKNNIYCMNCGKEYPSESAGEFCEKCGTKL
jgi:hypothetical protein